MGGWTSVEFCAALTMFDISSNGSNGQLRRVRRGPWWIFALTWRLFATFVPRRLCRPWNPFPRRVPDRWWKRGDASKRRDVCFAFPHASRIFMITYDIIWLLWCLNIFDLFKHDFSQLCLKKMFRSRWFFQGAIRWLSGRMMKQPAVRPRGLRNGRERRFGKPGCCCLFVGRGSGCSGYPSLLYLTRNVPMSVGWNQCIEAEIWVYQWSVSISRDDIGSFLNFASQMGQFTVPQLVRWLEAGTEACQPGDFMAIWWLFDGHLRVISWWNGDLMVFFLKVGDPQVTKGFSLKWCNEVSHGIRKPP